MSNVSNAHLLSCLGSHFDVLFDVVEVVWMIWMRFGDDCRWIWACRVLCVDVKEEKPSRSCRWAGASYTNAGTLRFP
jgi:hypothetical protein